MCKFVFISTMFGTFFLYRIITPLHLVFCRREEERAVRWLSSSLGECRFKTVRKSSKSTYTKHHVIFCMGQISTDCHHVHVTIHVIAFKNNTYNCLPFHPVNLTHSDHKICSNCIMPAHKRAFNRTVSPRHPPTTTSLYASSYRADAASAFKRHPPLVLVRLIGRGTRARARAFHKEIAYKVRSLLCYSQHCRMFLCSPYRFFFY